MTVERPPIVQVPAHVGNYGKGRPPNIYPEACVVHTTGGGATIEALDAWFQNPAAGVATSFGIGPDRTGKVQVHQYVSLADTAYAQGIVNAPTSQLCKDNAGISPNLWAVGCEMVDGGVPGNHSPEQRSMLAWLFAYLWETEIAPHGDVTGAVLPDRYRVIGHYELDSVNRAHCPSWPEQRYTVLIQQMINRLQPAPPKPPDPVPPTPPMDGRIKDLVDALTISRDAFLAEAEAANQMSIEMQNMAARNRAHAGGIDDVLGRMR